MKLPGATKTKIGYATGVEILSLIAAEHRDRVGGFELARVVEAQEHLRRLAGEADSKRRGIHTTYNQIGAATGRLKQQIRTWRNSHPDGAWGGAFERRSWPSRAMSSLRSTTARSSFECSPACAANRPCRCVSNPRGRAYRYRTADVRAWGGTGHEGATTACKDAQLRGALWRERVRVGVAARGRVLDRGSEGADSPIQRAVPNDPRLYDVGGSGGAKQGLYDDAQRTTSGISRISTLRSFRTVRPWNGRR